MFNQRLKLKTKSFMIALLIVFSCAKKTRPPYLISENSNINKYEDFDHQACLDLKLNFDNNSNIDSKLYWHCRLSFSKFHLQNNPILPKQIEFNTQISDLIAKISLKISTNKESFILQQINKMDELDHKKCLKMGYNPDQKNQIKLEEYYQCRKNLIEIYYSELPFNNPQYQPYQDKTYDIAFVIDKKIKESIQDSKTKIANNPQCSNFHVDSEDFGKCIQSFKEHQQCLINAGIKAKERDNANKIKCQKQAYIRFNDEMIKSKEREELEIQERNLKSDRDNRNNFESIGINERDFIGKSKLDIQKEEQEAEQYKSTSKFSEKNNTNNDLYTKQEISKLRKKFIVNCVAMNEDEITQYQNDLNRDCQSIIAPFQNQ